MRPFSICIIVKNEEKNIERCLRPLKDFDCEILVVDTGSTDRTVEIANRYATKVLTFPWVNDFSAARNFSIENARYDWILVLDCDEFVEKADPEQYMSLAKSNPTSIGLLERINLLEPDTKRGSYIDRVPRFFNRRYFHYEGTIHEQVCPLKPRALEGFYLPLTVLHTGYLGTPEEKEAKHLRNFNLLQEALAKTPDNPYIHFQLGQEYYNKLDYTSALEHYRFVLEQELNSELEYHRLSVISYYDCLLNLKRLEEAQELNSYKNLFGHTPDFHFLMGRIYYVSGNLLQAMSSFITATSMNNPCKEGTNTYLPWFHIGLINETLGDKNTACMFYEKCEDFAPALERLEILRSTR